MPGVGDQHKTNAAENPYEEVKPHINEYTAQEIATLSSRLEKQLGPEYISTRPGASGLRVPYLAADKCISLANEVFGFNGWSSGIQQIQIDFVDENQSTGRVSLGLSVIVRVTLRDGTYHEDIGYGQIENCKGKAAAFEKAKKEGTTDGLKRALRSFGNILGNCIYDKEYISKVTKIKVAPSRWDPENLHRHPDYAPAKKENSAPQSNDSARIKNEGASELNAVGPKIVRRYSTGELEDEFATDDFDEVDFGVSHEVNLDDLSSEQHAQFNSRGSRANTAGSRTAFGDPSDLLRPEINKQISDNRNGLSSGIDKRPQRPVQVPVPQQQVPRYEARQQPPRHPHVPPAGAPQHTAPGTPSRQQPNGPKDIPAGHDPLSEGTSLSATSATTTNDPPVGFFTARLAETVQNPSGLPMKVPSFNPHLESPSIRKTAGIDHSKTKPVGRDVIGAPPSPATISSAARPNFVNPQADRTRRVGMPTGAASPGLNRGSYKPPQMKRVAEGGAVQQSRPALGDVTSTTVNVPSDSGGGDAKRQRMSGPVPQGNGHDQGQATSCEN